MDKYLLSVKEKKWLDDFEYVNKMLRKHDIKYVLDGGNLLSILRDDSLFPHYKDGDIDFSIEWNRKNFEKIKHLKKPLISSGYQVRLNFFVFSIKKTNTSKLFRKIPLVKKISKLNDPKINISLYRKNGDNLWCTWLNKSGIDFIPRVIPSKYFDNIREIEYQGIPLSIPFESESYLSFKYGENWKEPNTEWKYFTDDGSIDKSWITKDVYQNW